jgi:hypothetical protein
LIRDDRPVDPIIIGILRDVDADATADETIRKTPMI